MKQLFLAASLLSALTLLGRADARADDDEEHDLEKDGPEGQSKTGDETFRAIALTTTLPRCMKGDAKALASHLGAADLGKVFPDHKAKKVRIIA